MHRRLRNLSWLCLASCVATATIAACDSGDTDSSSGHTTIKTVKGAHNGGDSGDDDGSGSDDGASGNGAGANGAGANGNGAGANGSGANGSGANGSGANGSGANGSGGNPTGPKGGGPEGDGIDHGAVVKLVVQPATATINVDHGKASTLALHAYPIYADGYMGAASQGAAWLVDQGDVATVDGEGNVNATGARGAELTVTATLSGQSASSDVTVKLIQSFGDTLSQADQDALDGASDPDPTAQLLYPYDGTIFPRGLQGPRVMWGGGSTTDVMSLKLTSQWVEATYYFHAAGPHAIDMPPDMWSLFTESGAGTQPAEMKLARSGNGSATVISHLHWRLAAGSLRGTVYYWANNLGRVVRIKPGASAPDDFLAAAGVSDGCTTCHAVSAKGNVLTLGGGPPSDSAASVFDLSGQQVAASNRGRAWAMLALSPDGKWAVLNNAPLPGPPGQGKAGLYSVATGEQVIMGSSQDATLFDMPAFAPDSSLVAFVDHDTHALSTVVFHDDPAKPVLNGQVSLIDEGSGGSIAFPSVSPDAAWAVYHRGSLDTRAGNGDLFLGNLQAGGIEIPLDAVNGTDYPFAFGDRDRHLNFEPSFLPVEAGDFFWVVFTSRRTLGNQLVDDRTRVKQLWVAAIAKDPMATDTVAGAPFWVPGQDPTTLNMRGFWALDPCKATGATCEKTSECCNGAQCLVDSHTCGQATPQTCVPEGGDCLKESDCCNSGVEGYTCSANVCVQVKL